MSSLFEIEEILAEAASPKLGLADRRKLLSYAKQKTEHYERQQRRDNFGEFVRHMWPDMIPNWHFDEIIAVCLKKGGVDPRTHEQVINIMPRVGKEARSYRGCSSRGSLVAIQALKSYIFA